MLNQYSETSSVNLALASLQTELEKPDNFFLEQLRIWVADQALHGVRYGQVIVDVGYDVSAAAETTGESFDPDQYETVSDFLEEINGNTVATYKSGSGLWTETLEDDFLDEARELLSNWAHRFDLSCDEWDDLGDEIYYLEIDEQHLLDMLASENLAAIVEQYRGSAEKLELERQLKAKSRQAEKQALDQLAAETAVSFFQATPDCDKFVISRKSELLGLLNALEARLGVDGKQSVSAFVHSRHLNVSNKLRSILQQIYPPSI